MTSILLAEDDLTVDSGSRDQYGEASTGSRLYGRSTRGRRQKLSGNPTQMTWGRFGSWNPGSHFVI